MTVREAFRDNRPTATSGWCAGGRAARKDKGAVVVKDIFAWHDKSLLLVLLCIAEKETAVFRADLRMTLGLTVGSKRRLFKNRGNSSTNVRHYGPPNVHNDSLLFLAKEGNAQRDLSVKSMHLKKTDILRCLVC